MTIVPLTVELELLLTLDALVPTYQKGAGSKFWAKRPEVYVTFGSNGLAGFNGLVSGTSSSRVNTVIQARAMSSRRGGSTEPISGPLAAPFPAGAKVVENGSVVPPF